MNSRDDLAPLVLRSGKLERLAVPTPKRKKSSFGSTTLDCDVIAFGDGSALVVWDGDAFRWNGGDLEPIPGEHLTPEGGPPSGVTLRDGSIAAIFGRKLLRVEPGGARATILPLGNVMSIAAGPDDALILREGNNVEGDVLKIWWPGTRELTSIDAEALGTEADPSFVVYSAAASSVVAHAGGKWRAIPWRDIAAMPRVGEMEFRARHGELTKRRR